VNLQLDERCLQIDLVRADRRRPAPTSTLEIPADEVKNGETELAFDIPPQVAKMLIEYREQIAPKVIGHRPERVFVRADGNPKSQAMVAHLITTYLRKRAGIVLSPHQFRHVVAEIILRDQPGAYELVLQLLGHKNIKTTIGFYAGAAEGSPAPSIAPLAHLVPKGGTGGRLFHEEFCANIPKPVPASACSKDFFIKPVRNHLGLTSPLANH
jgi:hypothetical protein